MVPEVCSFETWPVFCILIVQRLRYRHGRLKSFRCSVGTGILVFLVSKMMIFWGGISVRVCFVWMIIYILFCVALPQLFDFGAELSLGFN